MIGGFWSFVLKVIDEVFCLFIVVVGYLLLFGFVVDLGGCV